MASYSLLKNVKSIFTAVIIIVLMLISNVVYSDILYNIADQVDTRTLSEKIDDFQNNSMLPLEDVPRGHWAYRAVEHLASLGLLEGYEGGVFNGDAPVTRYEMAAIVSRILSNYLKWTDTGKITQTRKVMVEKPRTTQISGSDIEAAIIEAESAPREPVQVRKIPPPIPALLPSKEVAVTGSNGMRVTLSRTSPRSMAIQLPEEPEKPKPAPAKKPAPVSAAPEPPQFEERIEKVEKAVDLSQKDIDTIEKLVNSFKKEIKDSSAALSAKIKDVERITLKNQKQIETLKQEADKLKINGNNSFSWETGGPDKDITTTNMSDSFNLKLTSEPITGEELTLTTQFGATTLMGGRRGFKGYIEGTNTAFTLSNLLLSYKNLVVDPKHPKNFKLRTLSAGDTGVMFSPLTVFGQSIQGLNASVALNKYTINAFGARKAIHPTKPFFMPSDVDIYYDNTQYDRYLYGINLNANVFGEPKSMGNLSKIWMYDNKNTNYPGCRLGYWVDLNFSGDPFAYKDPNTDISYQDFYCGPPEKNSVTSAFIRYPLPLAKNLYVTAEYAHSTYYKPGYRAVTGETYEAPYSSTQLIPPDDVLTKTYCIDKGIPAGSKTCADIVEYQKREYPSKICDTNDFGYSHYTPETGKSSCWLDSKERRNQDDAFIFLLDYNNGPIKMFPIGYLRLGPEFSTKYFGLPGFDLGSSGLDMSILPISIQSLEAYVGNFTIDQLNEKHYSYTTYYVIINETKPMYFDPGALFAGFSNNSQKSAVLNILPKPIARLNTRHETLHINVWNNSFKYNISDNINLDIGLTKVKVWLPRDCLDGEFIAITNDQGQTIDYKIGNGVCTPEAPPPNDDNYLTLDVIYNSQSYKLFWKTSKKASFETSFGINNTSIALDLSGVPAVKKLINDLAPQGKSYSLSHSLKYKLTSSTELSMGYSRKYDRMPDSDDSSNYPVKDSTNFSFNLSTSF